MTKQTFHPEDDAAYSYAAITCYCEYIAEDDPEYIQEDVDKLIEFARAAFVHSFVIDQTDVAPGSDPYTIVDVIVDWIQGMTYDIELKDRWPNPAKPLALLHALQLAGCPHQDLIDKYVGLCYKALELRAKRAA